MMENPNRRDILEVVIGILLMLPVMIGVAWVLMVAIDRFLLRDPDAVLAHQASDPNSSQVRPLQAPSSSDFSVRTHNSKVHRDRLLRELQEAK